jgi:hypothetical protein
MRWSPLRAPSWGLLIGALIVADAGCHDAALQSFGPPNDTASVRLALQESALSTSSLAGTPTIYPGDGSVGWSFNGATDSLRSGPFTTGDMSTPFLAATDPASSGWLWAPGEAPGQLNAVKRTYPVSPSAVGPSFYYRLPAAQKTLYVRFLYQQGTPFNFDGTTNNQDWLQLVEFEDQNQQPILGAAAAPGGGIVANWNHNWTKQFNPAASFNLNTVLAQWTCYEMMVDLTVRRRAHGTIWVNDTVVLDNTIGGSRVPSARTAISFVRFDGAINSMKSVSTAWFTLIGVSSQRTGCPAAAPPPPPPPPVGTSQLALSTEPSSSAQSGVLFAQQPVVQLRDSAGTAVSQSGVVITAAIASGSGTLGGTTSATTDAGGSAAFSDLSITGIVGSRTLRFTSGTLTPAVSNAISLSAGPAAQVAITTQPSSTALSGVPLVQQPVVQLRDAANNAVSQSGVMVTAVVASGGGSLIGTATIATSTSGTAAFTNLAIVGTGTQSLQFTASGLTAATSVPITMSATGGDTATLLFEERFEDTNFGARGWYDLPSGGITSLASAEHIAGSTKSLQVNFLQGGTSPSPRTAARHLFTPTDAVYLGYWVKHSSNWVGSGKTYHPHEFHLLTTEDDAYVGPAWNHLTTYIEENVQSDGGHAVLDAQDGENIDVTRINQNLINVTENRAISGCNGNPDATAEITCYTDGTYWYNGKTWRSSQAVFVDAAGPNYKGDWHKVEAYFKLNSIINGIGQRDGIAQYWVDGVLVIDRHDLMFRTGAHPTMKFNQLMMAPFIGDGSPVAQTLWFDDLAVMTGRPSP